MKNIIKFKHEDKEGFLSVVIKDQVYYALAQKNTPKINDAMKQSKLMLSFEIKQPNFKFVDFEVSFDPTLIKMVYEALEQDKNLYFKQLDDTLCVLIIKVS